VLDSTPGTGACSCGGHVGWQRPWGGAHLGTGPTKGGTHREKQRGGGRALS
jgi:hypothetical protein